MNRKERVLSCFDFKTPEETCFDMMENALWPSLREYFSNNFGTKSDEEVLTLLDCDLRWVFAHNTQKVDENTDVTYASDLGSRPLSSVESVEDLKALFNPDPNDRFIPDFAKAHIEHPDHPLVFCPVWMPTFSGACRYFGMEQAMVLMASEPEIIDEFANRQCDFALEVLRRGIAAGARDYCDIYWLGDDFAGETGLMLSPYMWRKLIKPSLKKQVEAARSAGFKVIFHSCGSVYDIYPDLIEIGVHGHVGVQTSAKNMNVEKLAREFGGELVFFGCIDAQTTLVRATPNEVEQEVKRCLEAFSKCGGYIVSNSHHGIENIRGENIVAMAKAAGKKF